MDAISYKCPNCGGELVFSPEKQKYECPYCHSVFGEDELADVSAEGQEAEEVTASGDPFEGEREAAWYSCPSCGAQIVTEETTAATFCYFCHNPVMLQGRLSGKYLPDRIIPFKLDREKALGNFRSFIGKKWFIPKAFYQESSVEKMTGVYYPYWQYDADLSVSYEARGTKNRVWVAGDTEFTEVSVYRLIREGQMSAKDLTRNALQETSEYNRNLVEKVQPYDLKENKPFQMGYLSGFFAERRNMEQDAFRDSLMQETQGYASKLLKSTTSGYTGVRQMKEDFRLRQDHWHYILLPVWVMTYRGKNNKIYYFAMNGQNGKICGDFPVDYGKLSLFSGIISLVVFALLMIGAYLI